MRFSAVATLVLLGVGCADPPFSWCDGQPQNECSTNDDCQAGEVCGFTGIECLRRICEVPLPGIGGVGGDGGEAGSGGVGGEAGSGGDDGVPDGIYEFECTMNDLPVPIPFVVQIETASASPPFAPGAQSVLITRLDYALGPRVVVPEPSESVISEFRVVLAVGGATPTGIEHSIDGLPITFWPSQKSDIVTTQAMVAEPQADSVELSVSSLRMLVTNLPETIVQGGQLELASGEGSCTNMAPAEGSGPVVLPVRDRLGQ